MLYCLLFFPVNDSELGKLHKEMFGKKCESASDKMHSAVCTFTDVGTSQDKCFYVVTVCTLYSSEHGAFFSS